MESVNFENFAIPPEFQLPQKQRSVGDMGVDGVTAFDYEKEGYVAFRFAWTARPWKKEKVKKYGIDGSDSVPVILFYRDKDNQIPIKLRRKMRFEDRRTVQGEYFQKSMPAEKGEHETELDLWDLPIGFDGEIFQMSFQRWKEAGDKPGTPITAWRADPGQANTLAALGIFTVEQFGNMAEEMFSLKIRTLPPSISGALIELHQLAVAFVAGQSGRADVEALITEMQKRDDALEAKEEQLVAKEKEIEELKAKIKGGSGANKRGRKPKSSAATEVTVEDGVIKGVEE